MKKYLLWKTTEEGAVTQQPLLASTAPSASGFLQLPTVNADFRNCRTFLRPVDGPLLCQTDAQADSLTAYYPPSPLMSPSSSLSPYPTSPLLYNAMMLGGSVLRSQASTAQFKPIPNNERVDLNGYLQRDPAEWGMEDVIAWMIGVARQQNVPVEDMNMHRFADCSGALLLLMSQHDFLERDPTHGHLLYAAFRRLATGGAALPLDDADADWPAAAPSTSERVGPERPARVPTRPSVISVAPEPPVDAAPADAATLLDAKAAQKRNKDGKVRKRSQHSKGNKLWEFIRDTLLDPHTCPSIVRWEDRSEGIFRIIESEKLAKLWGDRKNNSKMTYEKLSRAMRTYYEKEILVTVPKSGLYPKKLVYKFGPNSHGWRLPVDLEGSASMAVETAG